MSDKQGLNPPEVWTREYVRTELWANVYGEPLPLDADPEPGDVDLQTDEMVAWLSGDCDNILDVGCGWMWYAAPEWLAVTGFDISPPMIELGKALHPDREFYQGTSWDMPFEDGEFCGVRSSEMLRHIKAWEPALAEMVRVADRRLAFTMLTDDEPRKCGPYQWCTTRKAVVEALPDGVGVDTTVYKAKDGWDFESTLFRVQL
jgi:SAM-dependent methyltransferase